MERKVRRIALCSASGGLFDVSKAIFPNFSQLGQVKKTMLDGKVVIFYLEILANYRKRKLCDSRFLRMP